MIGLAIGQLVKFSGAEEVFSMPTIPGKSLMLLVMATPGLFLGAPGSISEFRLLASNDGETFCKITEDHESEADGDPVGISFYAPPGRFIKVQATNTSALTITVT